MHASRAIGICLVVILVLAGFTPRASAGTVGCCTSGQYSFNVDLSSTGFLLPAGTVTVIQSSPNMLTVTIALAQQSGLQFNFRNNGQGDVSFNVPSGSVITPPAGTNWKVASTQQPLNLPTGLKMNAGLVFTGNNNGLPVTSLTFTIGNKNGISITSFVAANFNGKSIFWGAHVWGPLKNGTTNTGWVGATPIAASVPEPEAPLLVGVGLLVGGLFRRHFWQV